MRLIIAGHLDQSSGRFVVCWFDKFTLAMGAKGCIGRVRALAVGTTVVIWIDHHGVHKPENILKQEMKKATVEAMYAMKQSIMIIQSK